MPACEGETAWIPQGALGSQRLHTAESQGGGLGNPRQAADGPLLTKPHRGCRPCTVLSVHKADACELWEPRDGAAGFLLPHGDTGTRTVKGHLPSRPYSSITEHDKGFQKGQGFALPGNARRQ